MIGLAKRKMKPLDGWYIYSRCLILYSFQHRAADLFYLWKQERITFTKGWLSTYLHFASEVKNSCDLNCWNKGKKRRNVVISLTALTAMETWARWWHLGILGSVPWLQSAPKNPGKQSQCPDTWWQGPLLCTHWGHGWLQWCPWKPGGQTEDRTK